MLIQETDRAMSELSRRIVEELKQLSYRDLEERTGVSRGSLEGIAREQITEFPKLETLEKLAKYWKLPLWRVIEMAGVDLGLPLSIDELGQQLMSLAQRLPEIEPIARYLLKLYPEDLRGVIAYLKTVDQLHNQEEGWSGEETAPHQ
jgi:transcriptional regulator with XRE-family HTH domain